MCDVCENLTDVHLVGFNCLHQDNSSREDCKESDHSKNSRFEILPCGTHHSVLELRNYNSHNKRQVIYSTNLYSSLWGTVSNGFWKSKNIESQNSFLSIAASTTIMDYEESKSVTLNIFIFWKKPNRRLLRIEGAEKAIFCWK